MKAAPSSVVYRFGPFRLEPRERLLARGEESVPLTGKAFATLLFLVERHGRLVPKQELMDAVWPDTVVEENNLDRNLSMLRKALGEQANGEPYIQTVPRSGYRFVAAVTQNEVESFDPAPSTEPAPKQEIRFCITPDKTRLAYSHCGTGHPIVKVANCFTHLNFEWESPIWRHWVRDLPKGHCIFRYDGRGSGLSEWDVQDVSFEAWIQDLETVVDAAGLKKFVLFGHSQGGAVAIAYALRHPERVSHLVLCGGYSRGVFHRGVPDHIEIRRALETLVQVNWGRTNPAFYQLVTDMYIPENASPADKNWFVELQRVSISTANLVRYMQTCDDINVRPQLAELSVPTIVFHADRDRIAPAQEGRILAAEIPGARFVPLPTGNHVLLGDEPAWQVFTRELEEFLGAASSK